MEQPAAGKKKHAAPKKGSAAWKLLREQRRHTVLRLAIQLAFFALAPGLFSSALNGVKYICAQVGAVQAIEPTSFVAALVGAVAYTVLFGRFFCGYACAFGTMGDVLFALAAPLRRALHVPTLKEHPRLLAWLQSVKLLVLAAVCILAFTGFWDAVSAWDPWAVFGKVTSGAGFEGMARKGIAVLVVIMVLQAFVERSFCRFLCPMGALFSLLPIVPFSQFSRRRERCGKRCNRCQDTCPVDIHPDQGGFHAGECIACGRCAAGCPLHNVNLVFIPEPEAALEGVNAADASKPGVARNQKPLLKWQGSGVAAVAAKAVLSLALCWLLGLVRFAPSPSEILPLTLPWL